MDGGACWAAVHGVAQSQTRLSNFTFTFPFHALEKEMETHSSVLAWRIPGTGEPGGLPSMGSHRVGHDWSDLAAAAAAANSSIHLYVCMLIYTHCVCAFQHPTVIRETEFLHFHSLPPFMNPYQILGYKVTSYFVTQLVKNLPAMQETWVQSLGWEDPLEKGKVTPSSILAWRIPWSV